MRLDKYLSDMGIGTRSELSGLPVGYEEFVYYMLYKPAGVISASEDPREATVVDLITEQKRKDLFPVGRLDRDTEGLLIITNDGEMAHRLLSPRHHVDKTYFARVTGTVTEEDILAFREGLVLPDGLECLPAELMIDTASQSSDDLVLPGSATHDVTFDQNDIGSSVSEVEVTIREGKFHQIKRMFLALGHEVIYLKRLSMGPLELDPDLAPGEYRRLTPGEIAQLKSI